MTRATVFGLGLFSGGVAATRHLVQRGCQVTVTDRRTAEELAPSIEALRGLPIRYVLGEHDEADFRDVDVVVVNPAIPPRNPLLEVARRSGARLLTEIGMFVRACPARIVAVTGTAGKSTTTALLARCLEAGTPNRVFLGGNIGRSLLPDLPQMTADDLVALELSSFQLHWLRQMEWTPSIGVLTNVRPNHLDWHGHFEHYVADKLAIVPGEGATFVAGVDDELVASVATDSQARVVRTSGERLPDGDAVGWQDDVLIARREGREVELVRRESIPMLGEHVPANVAAAVGAALAAGARSRDVAGAVQTFAGLPHRMERVGTYRGMVCVNDSKSTTPDTAASALRAFDGRIWLIAGGYDKGLDLDPLLAECRRAHAVLTIGATGNDLCERVRAAGGTAEYVGDLESAVGHAFANGTSGDVLLLSPGHASWDQFPNFEERARAFTEALVSLGR